ncbi:MAG TPA: type II secretion system F family protein [Acidimicrobiales bacterium]|nr:type II secretion system F family protein [Acidimicrobiales bacterium]
MVLAALMLGALVAVRAAVRSSAVAATRRRLGVRAVLPSARRYVGRLVAPMLRARADRAVERDLPEVLDAVARSLRSGSSLRRAVDEAAGSATGSLADDLARVRRALDAGDPLGDALDRWAISRPVAGVRLAVAALSLGAETGGASAQAVDGVAATLRTNLGIAAEVRALSSQARLSALVIVLAPVAFSVLAFTTDPTAASFLLRTPLGLGCLASGFALDAVGWLWMRRLTAAVA